MEAGHPEPDSLPYGHVSMVFVDSERWGQGVGGVLLNAARGVAIQRGWVALSLWTRTSNEQAQRFYAKSGFRHSGEVTRLHDGDRIGRWRLPLASGQE